MPGHTRIRQSFRRTAGGRQDRRSPRRVRMRPQARRRCGQDPQRLTGPRFPRGRAMDGPRSRRMAPRQEASWQQAVCADRPSRARVP